MFWQNVDYAQMKSQNIAQNLPKILSITVQIGILRIVTQRMPTQDQGYNIALFANCDFAWRGTRPLGKQYI